MKYAEGYLMIDHRASPGIPGLPALFESGIYICGHCQGTVLKHPMRKRERHACTKCGTVICDGCAKVIAIGHECVPMEKLIDQALERAIKEQ